MPLQEEWTDIVITVPKQCAQAAQDIATAFTGSGLYVEDYSDLEQQVWEIAHVDLIEPALLEKPRDVVAIHLYLSAAEEAPPTLRRLDERLGAAGLAYTLTNATVHQRDWANEWKRFYHTTEVGRRLAVVPSWESYDGPRTVLRLDPGMAFGTGTHETTLLCLQALDERVRGGEAVLDVGTGSGILGIAALLLGAAGVKAIDIDPLAVRTARENAALNGVEGRFSAEVGDLAAGVFGRYHIITANIIADAIISLAPALPPLLQPGGVFLASGIISPRLGDVRAALEKAGFAAPAVRQMKDWVLLTARLQEG